MFTRRPSILHTKPKIIFGLTLIGLIILSVLLTIFSINFNVNQITRKRKPDHLFTTIQQYFVKQFSQPTFIPPATGSGPSFINQSPVINYGQGY